MQGVKNKLHVYGKIIEVPYHLHFGREMLDRMCEYNDYEALINADTGEKMTFKQLAQQTVNIALSLTRMGVGRGDVVCICSEKRMECMPTIMAVFCTGATYTSADITYGEGPLLHRTRISKPKVMFCSPTAYKLHRQSFDSIGCIQKYVVYGDELQDGAVRFKDFVTESVAVEDYESTPVDGIRDNLLILFSSGSTGLPKGLPWTHLGFLVNSNDNANKRYKKILITREWYYTYGLAISLSCLRAGCTVVFSVQNNEEDWWRAVEKYRIEILQLAPTSIVDVIKSPMTSSFDTSSVEMVMSSSTPVAAQQVEAIKQRLSNLKGVYQIYGLSEAGNACNELHAPHGPRDGSVGTPAHGVEVKVVDIDSHQTLGANQRGEICLTGPSLSPGYIGVDNADYLDEEGFFRTGDVGYYDEDKYFYILNRIKELMKYNDISIAPAELESILLRHPAVREVGVTGAPREDCGEAPTAFIALQPGACVTEDELVNFLHDRVTVKWRLAGGVRFVDKLPRGAGDKLDRKALKLML